MLSVSRSFVSLHARWFVCLPISMLSFVPSFHVQVSFLLSFLFLSCLFVSLPSFFPCFPGLLDLGADEEKVLLVLLFIFSCVFVRFSSCLLPCLLLCACVFVCFFVLSFLPVVFCFLPGFLAFFDSLVVS